MFENTPTNRAAIAARVVQVRAKEGISRDKMAQLFGISRSSIQLYESGERLPSADFLLACAFSFGTDIHWLLTGEERETPLRRENVLSPREEALLEQARGLSHQSYARLTDFLAALNGVY